MVDGSREPAANKVVHAPSWAGTAFWIVVAALAIHCAISSCDHDEIEHLHAAWLVVDGQRPFVDFLEHHPPTLWYALAPIVRAFEGELQSAILICRLLNLGALVLSLKALQRSAGRAAPMATLLLLGSWLHLRNSIEIRPDPIMAALCSAALLAWLRYLRSGRAGAALLAGACAGAATATLQKGAAFSVLLLAGTFLAASSSHPWRATTRGSMLFAGAAAVPVGAFAFALWRAGMWTDFWFWNFSFNRFAYLQAQVAVLSPWSTLGVALADQPLLWIAGLTSAALTLYRFVRRDRRAEPAQLTCSVIVLGLLAGLAASSFPFSHNLLMIAPPLALLGADLLEESPRATMAATWICGVLIAKTLIFSTLYRENAGHRQVQEWLLAHTRAGDTVYVPPPYHPVFRRDAGYFWFDASLKTALLQQICPPAMCARVLGADQRGWEAQPPVFVYLPPGERAWWPARWRAVADRYRPDVDVPGLYRLPREPVSARGVPPGCEHAGAKCLQ